MIDYEDGPLKQKSSQGSRPGKPNVGAGGGPAPVYYIPTSKEKDFSEPAAEVNILSVKSAQNFNYMGNKKGSNRDGFGTQTFPDGAIYTGDFKKGRFNGKGRLQLPYGDSYDGNHIL